MLSSHVEFVPLKSYSQDRWYATDGVIAVGPVAFDMLRRGVATGQIPLGSSVRHASWKVWRTLEEIESLSATSRLQAVEHLASISAGSEQRAAGPLSEPPPPPTRGEVVAKSSPDSSRRSSVRPIAVDPDGVLSSARTFDEGLLLMLSTAVTAASAQVGILHQWRDELGTAVTTFAHGPGAELLLGERLAEQDAALSAAKGGFTIMSEPHAGDAARYVLGRLVRCLPSVCTASMVPFTLHGRLLGMLEIGREWRPFRAREIARVEDIVDALAERALYMGWADD
jgi:hypothetical protein